MCNTPQNPPSQRPCSPIISHPHCFGVTPRKGDSPTRLPSHNQASSWDTRKTHARVQTPSNTGPGHRARREAGGVSASCPFGCPRGVSAWMVQVGAGIICETSLPQRMWAQPQGSPAAAMQCSMHCVPPTGDQERKTGPNLTTRENRGNTRAINAQAEINFRFNTTHPGLRTSNPPSLRVAVEAPILQWFPENDPGTNPPPRAGFPTPDSVIGQLVPHGGCCFRRLLPPGPPEPSAAEGLLSVSSARGSTGMGPPSASSLPPFPSINPLKVVYPPFKVTCLFFHCSEPFASDFQQSYDTVGCVFSLYLPWLVFVWLFWLSAGVLV
uniref:Uncharacterized protein n=1 Tax=Myotis myotis TaxID=51298 RepID=A0A7J7UPM2_MYOMY|nr:hypothetical protein mMyoMyo1_008545 [Myotis myotis]